MNNEVTIESGTYPHCSTVVRVSDELVIDGRIVLCISTGAAHLQTYATRDELRALGEMLLARAGRDAAGARWRG